MKIIKKEESVFVAKPEGVNINYYLRDEYELIYSEQGPDTTQTWHYHNKIFETIYILEGELILEWKEGEEFFSEIVKTGDFIEVEKNLHTFKNKSNKIAKCLAIKQVLSSKNNRSLFKEDKIVIDN